MRSAGLRILGILCLTLLPLCVWSLLRRGTVAEPPAQQPQPTQILAKPAVAKAAPIPSQALASALSSPAVPSTPLAPLPFAPSDLLLRARAGSFTPEDVTAAVAAFTARTPEAVTELARLAASSDASERLLALYLRLELDGPAPAILASAASDPSPWISSQAAEWLYFHYHFDLWKTYVQGVRAAWTPGKTSQVIANLAANSTGAPELSAGLVILQLGRALPDLVGALLKTAPELRAQLEIALLDPATASPARTALLDTFHETRPAGYLATLEKLILARGEDSPARFKAFVYYAGVADTSAGLSWLDSIAASPTQADPLAFRFDVTKRLLAEKATIQMAQTRENTRVRIITALTSVNSLRALSENDLRTLNRYIEQFREFAPERADAPALEHIATLLQAEPYRDYSARRLTAQVRALAIQAVF